MSTGDDADEGITMRGEQRRLCGSESVRKRGSEAFTYVVFGLSHKVRYTARGRL